MIRNNNVAMTSMKRDTLNKIIDVFLYGTTSTRADTALRCGISLPSICKVAKALIDNGYMHEKLYSSHGKRPSHHLSLSPNIKILVLDISSYIYSAYEIDNRFSSNFRYNYTYDPSSSFEENFIAFISRSKLKYAKNSREITCICVITPNSKIRHSRSSAPESYSPSERDKDIISSSINVIWRHSEINYITVSESIFSAMKYGAIENAGAFGGTSYIFLGTKFEALHVSADGVVSMCDPASLLTDNDQCLGNVISSGLTRQNFERIIIKTANFLDCAFVTQTLVIESDVYDLKDDDIHLIARSFASIGKLMPLTVIRSNDPQLRIEGAARFAIATFIKDRFAASDD